MIIEDTILFLRDFIDSDFEPLCELFADSDVMKFSEGVRYSTWVRQWLTDNLMKKNDEDPVHHYGVVRKSDNAFLGYCGLLRYEDLNGSPETELGFRLHRRYWKHGYGTRAAELMIRYAFDHLDLDRLVALVDPGNIGSRKVVTGIGMRFEKDVMLPGYDHADHLYAIHETYNNLTKE